MLMMVRVKGIYAPMFMCDTCGEQIRNADEGMVKFKLGDRSDLLFCHKSYVVAGCDRRSDDAEYQGWHELSAFMIWLEGNTALGRKSAEFKADFLHGV